MKFYGFHLMPWPYLPDGFAASDASSWVTISNELFDPVKSHDLYERYLSELVLLDELGFDGVCVNEHHQTSYGQICSPNMMASFLVPRTKGQLALMGNAISLHEHPLRVAEEVALLDVVSGGRVISGFVRGIGAEYFSYSMDPTQSRDRFYEAHDLIKKAWTEPGPFEWYGKHYKFRYVNPWPLPMQKPHPPIWSPSQGSGETVEWAAAQRYTYLQTFSDINTVRRVFSDFKEAAERHGYTAPPEQMGWSLPIFVADTDEEAERQAREHVEFLFNVGLRMPKEIFFPAGYLTLESMTRVMASKSGLGTSTTTFDYLSERNYVLVGSAETVRQRLEELQKEIGFGTLVATLHFGTLGHEAYRKSATLFAEKVMPALRPLGEQVPAGTA